MQNDFGYWLAQLLILVFYLMTVLIYFRARNEYIGGKIGAAINLILVFLVVLFISDGVDYFLKSMIDVEQDVVLILKILLRLVAMCVLFFGGLRFFAKKPVAAAVFQKAVMLDGQSHSTPAAPAGGSAADSGSEKRAAVRSLPTIGRYEILGQIGRGAMGLVYKGRDPKLNRLTAIKTIRFSDAFDEDKIDSIKHHFYREAEVVAKLSHPHIVTVYDVGEDLDLSYLAMEYLEGESLEKYTQPDQLLPEKTLLNIAVQVCAALEYAHQNGIIHRDIKPANIMLLKNGQVKVTDFGIARATTSTKTRTGIIKGTPYYMSPEQAQGKTVNGQSDIFSMGIVLYQMLSGRLPFEGDNMAAIMYQITSVEPEPLIRLRPDLNRGTLLILNHALEKDPAKRYQSAGRMKQHLEQLARRMDAVAGA